MKHGRWKKRRKSGMKIGGKHAWNYQTGKWNERKTGHRKWAFTYYQTKTRRGSKAKPWQGMPIGSKLVWRIKAKQYATKVTANKYKLVMKGTKYQENAKVKGKWINKNKRGR